MLILRMCVMFQVKTPTISFFELEIQLDQNPQSS